MSNSTGTGRRGFIKTLAAGTAAAGTSRTEGQTLPAQPSQQAARTKIQAERIRYPRTYSGRKLKMLAFPLGGIGTGSISLGGRGQFHDWEIYNRPDKGRSPDYALASIWVRSGDCKANRSRAGISIDAALRKRIGARSCECSGIKPPRRRYIHGRIPHRAHRFSRYTLAGACFTRSIQPVHTARSGELRIAGCRAAVSSSKSRQDEPLPPR